MANSKRLCLYCKTYHKPETGIMSNFGFLCSDSCRQKYGMKDIPTLLQRNRVMQEKAFRKETRARKEALKTKPQLTKEAQADFNKFIRLRDAGKPCISCGRTVAQVETQDVFQPGGYWDAGHYMGVGAKGELRFNEDNCHKQCKTCNGGAGQYSRKNQTVTQSYRVNLIEKIGLKRVLKLEGPIELPNYTHDQLRELRDRYRAKWRELSKKQAA